MGTIDTAFLKNNLPPEVLFSQTTFANIRIFDVVGGILEKDKVDIPKEEHMRIPRNISTELYDCAEEMLHDALQRHENFRLA